jgi:hypothetical protein
MKTALTFILLFSFANFAQAEYRPPQTTRSQKNLFGGENFYGQKGQYLGRSQTNTFKSKNYTNQRGKVYMRGAPNSNGTRYNNYK